MCVCESKLERESESERRKTIADKMPLTKTCRGRLARMVSVGEREREKKEEKCDRKTKSRERKVT